MKETHDWMPGSGWSIFSDVFSGGNYISKTYSEDIAGMTMAGKKLFSFGALPQFAGTIAPAAFQGGTGGNLATRNTKNPAKFLVTAKGAHKGRLSPKDFVEIFKVDWENKKIFINADCYGTLPSTDSLLVAIVFEMYPQINAWIHFHSAIKTKFSITLPYPSFKIEDRKKLSALIEAGAREINMVDHDILKIPDEKPDSAIIIGENYLDAYLRAKTLLSYPP